MRPARGRPQHRRIGAAVERSFTADTGRVCRAEIIASLQPVDLVVLFDFDTPIDLIRALKPEVLAKGADYKEDEVVGGDWVKAQGGRVVLVDLVPGLSTTNAIKRAKASKWERE